MRRAAGLLLALIGLAACAPRYPTKPAAVGAAPTAEAPVLAPAPTPPPPRQSPVPRPQASAKDQCGAAELQRLVGRPRTEVPVPLDPNRQRVACTTCPVTDDFDPSRLNFFFDVDALAEAMIAACRDPQASAPLRAAARATAVAKFSSRDGREAWIALLREMGVEIPEA